MRLAPTFEQQELKDAVRRFCTEQITPERLVAWEKDSPHVDDALWCNAATLGWFGLGLPAAVGGSGLGLVEVGCFFEEAARGLVPHAVLDAIRGGLALARLAPTHPRLEAVVRGECTVALAIEEHHRRDARVFRTCVTTERGSALVTGEKWYVRGSAADVHIVAAREGAGVSLVLVPSASAHCSALRTFDGDPQTVARYEGVKVQERLSTASGGAALLQEILRQQAALGLAEMIGGMDAVLTMTVDYVKQREQFGQKIAVFQAVQHQVADMATAFTAARHLAWQAITRLAAGSAAALEMATAATFVGQAFKRLTLTALHLHGGAGYVLEHPLHHHAERAQSLCIRYAPEAEALGTVAAALLDG